MTEPIDLEVDLPADPENKNPFEDVITKHRMVIEAQMWEAARVPKRYNRQPAAIISNPHWVEASRLVTARIGSGSTIVVMGPRGLGKSYLAVGALRAASGAGLAPLYSRAYEICLELEAVKETSSSVTSVSVLREYIAAKYLVIDGLDRVNDPVMRSRINYVARCRYESELDTVLVFTGTVDEFTISVGTDMADMLNTDDAFVYLHQSDA